MSKHVSWFVDVLRSCLTLAFVCLLPFVVTGCTAMTGLSAQDPAMDSNETTDVSRQQSVLSSERVGAESFPVDDDCVELSADGFRLIATNDCQHKISDIWVCRADASISECDNDWQKLGELKQRETKRIKQVYSDPMGTVFWFACYTPTQIVVEDERLHCM